MAKHYSPYDQVNRNVVFSSKIIPQTVKERVRQAFARRQKSMMAITAIPKLTTEMRKDIELGRPVINQ